MTLALVFVQICIELVVGCELIVSKEAVALK